MFGVFPPVPGKDEFDTPINSAYFSLGLCRSMAKHHYWSHLNRQQIGTCSEYFVKMEFTMHGFQVFTPEVDDRGVDFITRFGSGRWLEVQVKSIRQSTIST
jgi:hypothetical protein